ncbi:T9SS type A sorting domain-containing protein [candidate division KSB1 bacterium]|nr:T9SS type A sorting domain-containing protein [candidate division KSB1 bacterium]
MSRLKKNLLFILVIWLLCAHTAFAQDNVTQKLMMGYQGWFLCEGDNSAPNRWVHWFNSSSDPSASQIGIDFWPAMDEYKDTYNTDMTYLDGSTAQLYSAYDSSTINLHFKWMKEYGIHGVYLQRFLGPVASRGDLFESRNKTLENVIDAADTYDRHFAVMYDISGVADDGALYNKLITDWQYLVDTYDVLNQKGYVHKDGRPIIAIWGIGFSDRGLKPATFEQIIDYFHNTAQPKYQAYIMGGLPSRWRTLEGDSESDPAWRDVYNSLDMISPWTVGRYNNQSGIDNWRATRIIPDLEACKNNGVDYMPVIWPGFSWKNINDGPLNQIPRDGGKFFWRQAYNAIDAGAEFIYVAMFDEVDEGTAMFKLAENKSQVPVEIQDRIVTLDADGYDLPNDWYLRLAGETQKMLDGSIALTSTIPITPYEGNFREYISLCETRAGWRSGNVLTLNTSSQKRGAACLQSTGSNADEFRRKFPMPFSAGSSTSIGFWYYVSDVNMLDSDNQVELGSGGEADANEYNWTLDTANLKNDWNYIKLDFADAAVTGGEPNKQALDWFRIVHSKKGVVTTRIDDIKFRGADGVQMPVADAGPDIIQIDNNEDKNEIITLDASASIDFDGSITRYSWVKEGAEIATGEKPSVRFDIGTHIVILTVTDNDGHTDSDQIIITVQAEIDACDSETGWQSANELTVNTTDQKKGTGCLQSVGSLPEEFSKQLPSPLSADGSTSVGFWYFISDVSLFDADNQVELGSGGEADVHEYSWSLDNLQNGWNYVILYFSDAQVTGGQPDLEQINWFRIYHAKTGAITSRIDDIKFRGSGGNQIPIADAGPNRTIASDSTGTASVSLDGSASFDIDGSIVSYLWREGDSEIGAYANPTVVLSEGIHVITLTVTDNVGATNDDLVTITVDGGYFDDCDAETGWDSANSLSLNTTDQKQGLACLEATGDGTDDYKKVFSKAVSITAYRSIEFWYYVSDVSKLTSNNQLEIGSAGRPDQNEYNWNVTNLKNGWNYIKLDFARAGVTGNAPDPKNINWFRLYRFKNGDVISRIDGIKFSGVNESPVADAGADQTLTDDDSNGSESVKLNGSGSIDLDGSIVRFSWTTDGSEIAAGKSPTVNLPIGTHIITLTVTDNGGATAHDDVTITIEHPAGIENDCHIPTTYTLRQNHPNPFNPKTTIRYSIPQPGRVQLTVYDVLGKQVVVLVNDVTPIGYHNVEFDASDLSSGVYYYRLRCNGFVQTKKLVLLR